MWAGVTLPLRFYAKVAHLILCLKTSPLLFPRFLSIPKMLMLSWSPVFNILPPLTACYWLCLIVVPWSLNCHYCHWPQWAHKHFLTPHQGNQGHYRQVVCSRTKLSQVYYEKLESHISHPLLLIHFGAFLPATLLAEVPTFIILSFFSHPLVLGFWNSRSIVKHNSALSSLSSPNRPSLHIWYSSSNSVKGQRQGLI